MQASLSFTILKAHNIASVIEHCFQTWPYSRWYH